MNVECRRKEFYRFYKKTEHAYFAKLATKDRSNTILRKFAVHYSAVLRTLDHVFSVVCFSPVLRFEDKWIIFRDGLKGNKE
jgi:hypothetical protein